MSASLYDLIVPLQPFAKRLVDLAGRAGVQPRVTSTLRTRSEQERLYAAYLRGETHYPVAPPGTSSHEFGFAFDMIAATREDLHDLGTVWIRAGGLWTPDDEVHFQYPGFVSPPPTPDSWVNNPPQNVIARVAEGYANLPWWVSMFLPTALTVSHGSISDQKQSIGGRTMCSLGFKQFC